MIGIIIKNMRTEAGLSQKELAKKLNLADTTISSYERGNSQPDFRTILEIFKICGYRINIVSANDTVYSIEDFSRAR